MIELVVHILDSIWNGLITENATLLPGATPLSFEEFIFQAFLILGSIWITQQMAADLEKRDARVAAAQAAAAAEAAAAAKRDVAYAEARAEQQKRYLEAVTMNRAYAHDGTPYHPQCV